MAVLLFLGFILLLFLAFYKLANTKKSCLSEHQITISGKLLNFVPISENSIGVMTEEQGQQSIIIYDGCTGKELKKFYFKQNDE